MAIPTAQDGRTAKLGAPGLATSGETDELLPRPRWRRWLAARPRIGDVFVILVCVVPITLALLLQDPPMAWLGYLCAAGVAVALWWRRSHPFAVMITVVALGTLNPMTAASFAPALWERCFTLYTIAAQRRPRAAVIGYFISEAVVLAAIGLGILLGIRTGWSLIALQPSVLAAIAIGIAVRASRARRAALESLVVTREERAAAAERSRITAEMHDVVAHSVTVMVALAGGAAAGWEKHPERARVALEQLGAVGSQALADMQRILRVLRSNDAELDRNLEASGHNAPDLPELVSVFRAAGLPVQLTTPEPAGEPDPALRTTVYRIVQESLTNALRYAESPTVVEVSVRESETHVTVSVTDNGQSVTPRASVGAGVGLRAMRERAEVFGGTLEAGQVPTRAGTPSRGWRVLVTLPLGDRDRAGAPEVAE